MVQLVAIVLLAVLVHVPAAFAGDSALDKAMRKDPDRFAERAMDLIAGFGGVDGLRAEGIEDYVALERAGARASAMRRVMAMDLDADGTVDRAELSVGQRAASASSRGRLERQFAGADRNTDGRVDAGEMKALGEEAALRALDEAEARLWRDLMTLDADGDGALLPDELQAAMMRIEDPT